MSISSEELMLEEIKNLVDYEQAEMEKQNKSLKKGTIFWGVLWVVALIIFIVASLNTTVLWVWLLGLYFEYYRIKDGNLATYRARVNSFMLSHINKKLTSKSE